RHHRSLHSFPTRRSSDLAALKRFFDLVGGGMAPPIWFGYLIAAIQLFGGLAILIGFMTRPVAYAFVLYLIFVVYFAHNFWDMQRSEEHTSELQSPYDIVC